MAENKGAKGIHIEINFVLKTLGGKGWEWKRGFQGATWRQPRRRGEGTIECVCVSCTVHLLWRSRGLPVCLSHSIWISIKYPVQTIDSGKCHWFQTLIYVHLRALMWLFLSPHMSTYKFQVTACKHTITQILWIFENASHLSNITSFKNSLQKSLLFHLPPK